MGTLIRFKAYSLIKGYWSLWVRMTHQVDKDGKTALSILASEAPGQVKQSDTNVGSAVVRLLEFFDVHSTVFVNF